MTIKTRFLISTILFSILLMGGLLTVFLKTSRSLVKKIHLCEIQEFSETLRRRILHIMESGDRAKLQEIEREVSSYKRISDIKIFNSEGIEINGHEVLPERRKQECLNEKRLSCREIISLEKTALFFTLKNEGKCVTCHIDNGKPLAFVQVTLKTPEVKETLNSLYKWETLIGGLFIVFMIFSVHRFFTDIIEKPLKEIRDKVSRYENGEDYVRINVKSLKTEDLKKLGENLNTMFIKLNNAMAELKEFYQEKMQRADRLATLGELASSVAHEVKNPLAGIKGALQILLKEGNIPEDAKGIMREIIELTERLDRTVKNLLAFAKDTPPNPKFVNINDTVEKALFLIEQQARSKDIEIIKHLSPDIRECLMDEEQIQQVIVNLVLNAVQAIGKNGKVIISTRKTDNHIELRVEDTGPGIPEFLHDRIFEPFFTTKPQGTGLGLYICKKILKEHGGDISLKSTPPQGAKFIVKIPMKG